MPPPVVKTLTVPLPPARAFALFTEGMAGWWPFDSHSLAAHRGSRVARLALEPALGGAILETGEDGQTCPWGRITGWEPGARFAMTWHVGRSETQASLVEVQFAADPAGCRVTLTHSGWEALGEDAEAVRASYLAGWDLVFGARYGAAAREA